MIPLKQLIGNKTRNHDGNAKMQMREEYRKNIEKISLKSLLFYSKAFQWILNASRLRVFALNNAHFGVRVPCITLP